MAHEVAQDTKTGRELVGPIPVGGLGCLLDGEVIAHVVDDPAEAMIEDRIGMTKDAVHVRGCAALNGARGIDFAGHVFAFSGSTSVMGMEKRDSPWP